MKLATLLLIAAATVTHALDFRPIVIESAGEGGKYSYLQFRDQGKTVTYMPPKAWLYSGQASRLGLAAPGTAGAEIDISALPLKESMAVESSNFRAFAELARRSLPAEASKVELADVTYNPLNLDGHRTIEMIFTYVIFGGPVKVSLLYAVRENELLCFRVVARPEDFDRLHQAFKLSLHSLAGL